MSFGDTDFASVVYPALELAIKEIVTPHVLEKVKRMSDVELGHDESTEKISSGELDNFSSEKTINEQRLLKTRNTVWLHRVEKVARGAGHGKAPGVPIVFIMGLAHVKDFHAQFRTSHPEARIKEFPLMLQGEAEASELEKENSLLLDTLDERRQAFLTMVQKLNSVSALVSSVAEESLAGLNFLLVNMESLTDLFAEIRPILGLTTKSQWDAPIHARGVHRAFRKNDGKGTSDEGKKALLEFQLANLEHFEDHDKGKGKGMSDDDKKAFLNDQLRQLAFQRRFLN